MRDVLLKKQSTPYNRNNSRIAPVNYNFTILRTITNGIFVEDKNDKLLQIKNQVTKEIQLNFKPPTRGSVVVSQLFSF